MSGAGHKTETPMSENASPAGAVTAYRNQILARLSPDDLAGFSAHLEPVTLSFRQPLYEQGGPADAVYFVESGIVSLVTLFHHGGMIETGMVGNEGVVGLPAFLGMDAAPGQAVCQIPGTALKLNRKLILAERHKDGRLADLLFRYTNVMLAVLAQCAACNRAHALEERMSRWLLMTHDRVDGDEFHITQQLLAEMLGVRRPAANLAGASLQAAGFIRYRRGRITIVDRDGLEGTACECYANMKREFALAFGS